MTTTDAQPISPLVADLITASLTQTQATTNYLIDSLTAQVSDRDAEAAARRVLRGEVTALRHVLADRERELLDLKGPCSNTRCRLHYAHSGPCDITGAGSPA